MNDPSDIWFEFATNIAFVWEARGEREACDWFWGMRYGEFDTEELGAYMRYKQGHR